MSGFYRSVRRIAVSFVVALGVFAVGAQVADSISSHEPANSVAVRVTNVVTLEDSNWT
ncbi:hypothetical protein ACIRPK_29475 [Kitasatospora sp. NPDC101801]|uniref:hypothetical protein n=1 Tax=unclassified Kitasatospora TaxID=2633591 RepID=UPI00324DA9A8